MKKIFSITLSALLVSLSPGCSAFAAVTAKGNAAPERIGSPRAGFIRHWMRPISGHGAPLRVIASPAASEVRGQWLEQGERHMSAIQDPAAAADGVHGSGEALSVWMQGGLDEEARLSSPEVAVAGMQAPALPGLAPASLNSRTLSASAIAGKLTTRWRQASPTAKAWLGVGSVVASLGAAIVAGFNPAEWLPALGPALAAVFLPARVNMRNPDNRVTFFDQFTGRHVTEVDKLKMAKDMAASSRLGSVIFRALSNAQINPLFRVENAHGPVYYARSLGDDPEISNETERLYVFTDWAIRYLSPQALAADLAAMAVRHFYSDKIPESAEKTYVEGSVRNRVFAQLTNSDERQWAGELDTLVGRDEDGDPVFSIWEHYFFWIQTAGASVDDVRLGRYFKDKIVLGQSRPDVFIRDRRAQTTLFQRSQAGQISDAAATAGQEKFAGFVQNER
ncbi:MAG: hypothetical protein HY549_13315 [Elusimicrobia bacterium]|nr:hypothetical protein [Elusimicrobiota bacterium]